MPSHYAHYRFGAAILPTLPGDVRRSVQRFRRLYDVGLHGPDIFYYYRPMSNRGNAVLGIVCHEQSGKAFFSRISRSIRMENSEAAAAYLYGVLCHYVLDSVMHDAIRRLCADTGVSHGDLESEFDRYLLELDKKFPPDGKGLTEHLKLTEGECETVARFYPPAAGKTVRDALAATVRATRLLTVTEGPGRKILEAGLNLLGREAAGVLMKTGPDPRCAHLDGELLGEYQRALELFPDYLQQMYSHMTYNATLDGPFEKPFG